MFFIDDGDVASATVGLTGGVLRKQLQYTDYEFVEHIEPEFGIYDYDCRGSAGLLAEQETPQDAWRALFVFSRPGGVLSAKAVRS